MSRQMLRLAILWSSLARFITRVCHIDNSRHITDLNQCIPSKFIWLRDKDNILLQIRYTLTEISAMRSISMSGTPSIQVRPGSEQNNNPKIFEYVQVSCNSYLVSSGQPNWDIYHNPSKHFKYSRSSFVVCEVLNCFITSYYYLEWFSYIHPTLVFPNNKRN